MASGTKLPVRQIVLAGAIVLVIIVLINGGFGNALALAGLIALVAGVAARRGRTRRAGSAARLIIGCVGTARSRAGLIALVVGVAASRGRTRWAGIAARRTAIAVAVGGA